MFVKNIVRATKINDLFSVKDKVVLIGGAGGLGSCLAKGFLDNEMCIRDRYYTLFIKNHINLSL